MEGRAVLAWFDASTDKLTLWSAGQTPHFIKRMLVEMLELDDEHVRVITPNVGGGFGPKGITYPEEAVLVPWRACYGGRSSGPKIGASTSSPPPRSAIRCGAWRRLPIATVVCSQSAVRWFTAYGRLRAARRGQSADLGDDFAWAYVLPNYRLKVESVYTNKPAVTPLRGAGRPQAVFVMERAWIA